MKKGLLFLVILAILSSLSTAYAKGEITDFDAFQTYMGKSKSQVKMLRPDAEEFASNLYDVDVIKSEDNVLAKLEVNFDDNNKVNAVAVVLKNEYISSLGVDTNLPDITLLGSEILGINIDTIVNQKADDKFYWILYPNGVGCVTYKEEKVYGEDYYIVSCVMIDSSSSSTSDEKQTENKNTINTGDSLMTLVDTNYSGTTLVVTLLFENISNQNITISEFDFEAKDGNYEKLNIDWFDCPGSSLSGTLVPGDKLKGNICFENAKTTPIKISYQPNLFSDQVYTITLH